MSHERYHITLDGPFTTVTERPDGEWSRWAVARAAAIQHIEEIIAECQEALWVLRRSPTFAEYMWLRGGTTPPVRETRWRLLQRAGFRDQ